MSDTEGILGKRRILRMQRENEKEDIKTGKEQGTFIRCDQRFLSSFYLG